MPFVSAPGRAALTRVYDRNGIGYRKSMKTSNSDLIREMQDMVERFRRQKRWAELEAIIADRLKMPDVYEADTNGTLSLLMEQLATEDAAQAAASADPDLDAWVAKWAAEEGTNAKYIAQVRRLIPEGTRFPLSQFRRKVIAQFLRALPNAVSKKRTHLETRKRYRVAISMFAKYLIENELLEHNPTRDIDLGRNKPRQITYLEPAQVKLLVEALPMPHRALEACMAATGMEWGAVAALRRRDVDFDRRIIYAAGTKNDYRNRYVEASEEWAWDIFAAYARRFMPNARLFAGVREEKALEVHHETAATLELPRTTLHQHRNSYAVMWINRSGGDAERLQWLKNQLGHAPQSMLVFTRYGLQIKAARLTAKQEARLGRKAEGV